MSAQMDDVAIEWLLWVRKLRGMARRGVNTQAALDGLIGPLAMSDDDMPAYLLQLAETYGELGK